MTESFPGRQAADPSRESLDLHSAAPGSSEISVSPIVREFTEGLPYSSPLAIETQKLIAKLSACEGVRGLILFRQKELRPQDIYLFFHVTTFVEPLDSGIIPEKYFLSSAEALLTFNQSLENLKQAPRVREGIIRSSNETLEEYAEMHLKFRGRTDPLLKATPLIRLKDQARMQ